MIRRLLAVVSLFCFSFIAMGAQEGQDKPQHTVSHHFPHGKSRTLPQSLPQLKQQLQWYLASEKVPGAQVVLFNSKDIYWQQALGQRDKDKGLPVEKDTLFRGGSTTKTFVALAIMQLSAQGKLTLQDKVYQLAPEVKIENPWREQHPVTVAHLLEHTAGLDDMHFRNIYNVADPGISLLDAVNRDAGALKVRWPPGTRHAYSNPGYGILGYLVEKISGQSFGQYLREQIFHPAGMLSSAMEQVPALQEKLSRGYEEQTAVPYQDIYLRSAGSLHTTAYELALLGRLLLSRDHADVLPNIDSGHIRQMERPGTTLAAQAGLEYGYGLGIYASGQSGRVWLGHGGAIAGFMASYGYSPEIDQGYALLVNSDSAHIRPLLALITGYLVREHQTPELDEPAAGVDAAIDGYYRMANDRNAIFAGLGYLFNAVKIESTGSEITLKPVFGGRGTLLHVGGQQFREPDNPYANAVFIRDLAQGKVFDFDGQYYVETSPFAVWGMLSGISLSLVLVVLNLFYLPVWLINGARGKLSGKGRLSLRLYPALASLSMCAVMLALSDFSPREAGQLNWQSLFLCVFTGLFAVSSLLAAWQLIKMWRREPHSGVRYFSLLLVIALLILTLYGWHFNYVGLRLWAW